METPQPFSSSLLRTVELFPFESKAKHSCEQILFFLQKASQELETHLTALEEGFVKNPSLLAQSTTNIRNCVDTVFQEIKSYLITYLQLTGNQETDDVEIDISGLASEFNQTFSSHVAGATYPKDAIEKKLSSYVKDIPNLIILIQSCCKKFFPIKLKKIKVTSGDSHSGFRPAIIELEDRSTYVYKPRSLFIEYMVLNPINGFFSKINKILEESSETFRLPTRNIIAFEDHAGFEEFVNGVQYDATDYSGIDGSFNRTNPFIQNLIECLGKEDEKLVRYEFLRQLLYQSGLGLDAHIDNFIFDEKSATCEPIDLEVFSIDTTGCILNSLENLFESFLLQDRFSNEKKMQLNVILEKVKNILNSDKINSLILNFKKSLLNEKNLFTRLVPISTGQIKSLMKILGQKEFAEYIIELLEKELKKQNLFLNAHARKSLEIELMQDYQANSIPKFIADVKKENVWYNGIHIAEAKKTT